MQLQAKELHHKLKFKCKHCGQCCNKPVIQLYPFDIKNICQELNISTKQFHQQYSLFQLDEDNIPRCILKNKPKCPFRENKCTLYNNRPIRCRLYPVGRIFQEDITYVLPENKCPGFDSGKKQTIQEWLDQQNITEYDPLTKKWNDFIINLKDHHLNPMQQIIFRKVFYDFDDPLIKKYRKENNFMNDLYYIFEMLTKKIN